MNAHNEKQHQQPAAAQEAVGYVHGEPQFGNAGRKIGVLTSDVPVGTKLYAAPVTAAPAEPELDAHDPASGELAAQWLYGHGFKELAFVVRTQLDMRGARIRELSASTPAAPGIDLREIGGVMAEAEKHVETLHSLCPRASVFECIKRLRKAQAALIDASPKGGSEAQDAVLTELVEAISAFKGKRGAFMALGAQDERTVRLWSALAKAQAGDGVSLNDLPGMWEKADLIGGATDVEDSPKGGSEAPAYTTGHCENHKKPGGCPLHNLQCGYPQCDRQPASDAEVRP